MVFLLNARSRTVHCGDAEKSCSRLRQTDPENIMSFDSLEAALAYFPGSRPAKKCPFCLGKIERSPDADR